MVLIHKDILIENYSINKFSQNINEIETLLEKVDEKIDSEVNISKEILNSFNLKDELNDEFWKNNKLTPEIKKKLKKICEDFYKSLEIPKSIKIQDILFVGSLANYNWSKFSDIDLHLVLDFSEFKDDKEQIKKRFDAEKNLWNLKHEITVLDYPVEVYVQDVKEKLSSTAVYSILRNKWLLEPKKEDFKADKNIVKKKAQKIIDKLSQIKKDYEDKKFEAASSKADNLKNDIKKMRKAGLESGGEFSTENLVFKILRRTDFIELLDTYKNKAYDNQVSLNEDTP
jgi:predicted nucleotidyltransferase